MVEKKYSVDVTTIQQLDIYDVCELFAIDDSSGALQHAIKKLLRAGKGPQANASGYQRGPLDPGPLARQQQDTGPMVRS